MHIVDAVTFESSKIKASHIYERLTLAKIKGLKYSVIRNGMGAIIGTLTLGITVEPIGYKVVVMPRKGSGFIEYASCSNFEKRVRAIICNANSWSKT